MLLYTYFRVARGTVGLWGRSINISLMFYSVKNSPYQTFIIVYSTFLAVVFHYNYWFKKYTGGQRIKGWTFGILLSSKDAVMGVNKVFLVCALPPSTDEYLHIFLLRGSARIVTMWRTRALYKNPPLLLLLQLKDKCWIVELRKEKSAGEYGIFHLKKWDNFTEKAGANANSNFIDGEFHL